MKQLNHFTENYIQKKIENEITEQILKHVDQTVHDNALLSQDYQDSLLELDKCLKNFKKGKALGHAGLSLKFYLTFWDTLAIDLLTLFNDFARPVTGQF